MKFKRAPLKIILWRFAALLFCLVFWGLVIFAASCSPTIVQPMNAQARYYCPVNLPYEWEATKGKAGTFELFSQFGIPVSVTKTPVESPFELRGIAFRNDLESCKGKNVTGCAARDVTGSKWAIYYPALYTETEHHELCHAYRWPMPGHHGWSKHEN